MIFQLFAMLIIATLGKTQSITSVPFTDAIIHGVVSVGVGSPATQYSLILDARSANTWVGAGKAYVSTNTSTATGQNVGFTYGAGVEASKFSGKEYTDQVTLVPDLVVTAQSIGVAETSTGFQGFDGVLGLGPTALSLGTLSPDSAAEIPTVTDNLFKQGTISAQEIGIYAEPSQVQGAVNGEITFGGVDISKITSPITFVPITTTSPASQSWGLDASFLYGTTNILGTTAGVIDHGTSLLQLATNAFQAFQQATGGVPDSATGLLQITAEQYDNLQSLFFSVGGTNFEITKNALIWPRALNTMIGGSPGSIYLVVADIGAVSGAGLDFVIGYSILKRFYTVFDSGNARIAIATTSYTNSVIN